jgi:hypothetical protein
LLSLQTQILLYFFTLTMSPSTDRVPSSERRLKRKRDEDARRIINDFQRRQESGRMSPETERIGNVFFNMANKSIERDDVDQDLLLAGWESFVKAADQTRAAREVQDDCNQKIVQLEKQLEDAKATQAKARAAVENAKAAVDATRSDAARARSNEFEATRRIKNMEFLFELGDWTQNILKEMAAVELTAKKADESDLHRYHRGTGLGPDDATNMVKKDLKWHAMRGRMTTDTHERVSEERERVETWRKDGEPADSAPWTPFLDRIEHICNLAGVPRAACLEWIRIYSDRNELAHRPPPRIEDFREGPSFDGDDSWKSFNWSRVKEAIEDRKAGVEARYAAGDWDEAQRDLFIEVIDQYWSNLSNGLEPDGTPSLTNAAKDISKDIQKNAGKKADSRADPPAHYPRSYKKGKWDDIPREES